MFLLYQGNQRTKSTNKKSKKLYIYIYIYVRIKNQSHNSSILNIGLQKKLTYSSVIIS